jgi:hypothetical protein
LSIFFSVARVESTSPVDLEADLLNFFEVLEDESFLPGWVLLGYPPLLALFRTAFVPAFCYCCYTHFSASMEKVISGQLSASQSITS